MRQTKDLKFTGSTPVRDTNYASVAQLDVQHPSKVKVAGSSPVGGTRGGGSLTRSKTSPKFGR